MDRAPVRTNEVAYFFPCPVCSGLRPVRQTKTAKPYLRCDPCGVQLFVRGDEGIKRFRAAVRTLDGQRAPEAPENPADTSAKQGRGRPPKPPEVRERVERAVEKVVRERQPLGALSVTGIGR
jgi:hypothetical protein